jgi:ELWxxDGT repeat protein
MMQARNAIFLSLALLLILLQVSCGDNDPNRVRPYFFSALDETHGTELWKTDGTSEGTVLVKDINPSIWSSNPQILTYLKDHVYFVADDGEHGYELWKSDGTEAGTVMVKDLSPGASSTVIYTMSLVSVNGILYFTALEDTHGAELWKTDGTEAGTIIVKDIFPGAGGAYPYTLTNVNGTLFFSAYDEAAGAELWKTDGTEDGTVMVKDIFPGTDPMFGPGGPALSSDPSTLTKVGEMLYFIATDGLHGREMWKSDGTTAGTNLIRDINPGTNNSM